MAYIFRDAGLAPGHLLAAAPRARFSRVSNRLRRAAEWLVWLAHSPMFAFWLLTAVVAVGAIVTCFRSPKQALELLAPLGALVGVTEAVARAKGVPAWPTRTAYEVFAEGEELDEALDEAPDEAPDADHELPALDRQSEQRHFSRRSP